MVRPVVEVELPGEQRGENVVRVVRITTRHTFQINRGARYRTPGRKSEQLHRCKWRRRRECVRRCRCCCCRCCCCRCCCCRCCCCRRCYRFSGDGRSFSGDDGVGRRDDHARLLILVRSVVCAHVHVTAGSADLTRPRNKYIILRVSCVRRCGVGGRADGRTDGRTVELKKRKNFRLPFFRGVEHGVENAGQKICRVIWKKKLNNKKKNTRAVRRTPAMI